MKINRLLLTLFICFLTTFSFAQSWAVVGYENGKVDTFKHVEYRKPAFKRGYLLADADEIKIKDVKYYENTFGHFRKFSNGLSNSFYEREFEGERINTYFRIVTNYNNNMGPGGFNQFGGGYVTQTKKELFSVDDKTLLPLKVGNLKRATSNCRKCNEILSGTRRKDMIRYSIVGVGAGLLVYGIYDSLNGQVGSNPGTPGQLNININPLVVVGILGITVPLWINDYRGRDMKKVIAIYNERG